MTSDQVRRLKRAILQLSSNERDEIRKFLKEIDEDTLQEREKLNEDFNKSLGPVSSGGCPMCGK